MTCLDSGGQGHRWPLRSNLMNSIISYCWSNLDETQDIAVTDDLARFWRSKVKIIPWFKYLVGLGRHRHRCWSV